MFTDKANAVLAEKTSLLDDNALLSYVKYYQTLGAKILEASGDSPLPFYVLDRNALVQRTAEFRKAFEKRLPDTAFFYAMKSNNCAQLIKTILGANFGLDVSSGEELKLALTLCATAIIFSGPGKNDTELELAVMNNQRVTVLMDSFGELKRLGTIAKRHKKTIRTGVRLTTNPDGLWKKFGILPGELNRFIAESKKYDHIRLEGIQFHTSWNMTPDKQVAFIRNLGATLVKIPMADLRAIRFMDIGGGYWPEPGEWLQPEGTPQGLLKKAAGIGSIDDSSHYVIPASPLDDFAEMLSMAIRTHIHSLIPCTICFEPGRWICHDAMHLMLGVVDKKSDDLVITDGGTNAIGWERFETDYFPVINLSRPSLQEKRCYILGSLCTPRDIWGYAYFGETIEPGDTLMIPSQGAYTYSLRQQFIKAVPEVVVYPPMI